MAAALDDAALSTSSSKQSSTGMEGSSFLSKLLLSHSCLITLPTVATMPIPMVQVDAHNIVPCWVASPKLEYSARTIRSKIQALLPKYLPDLPPALVDNPGPPLLESYPCIAWDEGEGDTFSDNFFGHFFQNLLYIVAFAALEIDRTVEEVNWLAPGAAAAKAMLKSFVDDRLKDYADKRNDPNLNVASHLSPYFHFGQLSPQRAGQFTRYH